MVMMCSGSPSWVWQWSSWSWYSYHAKSSRYALVLFLSIDHTDWVTLRHLTPVAGFRPCPCCPPSHRIVHRPSSSRRLPDSANTLLLCFSSRFSALGSAGPYSPASHRMGTPNTGRGNSPFLAYLRLLAASFRCDSRALGATACAGSDQPCSHSRLHCFVLRRLSSCLSPTVDTVLKDSRVTRVSLSITFQILPVRVAMACIP